MKYQDVLLLEKKSVKELKTERIDLSRQIASELIQLISPQLTLENSAYPPTIEIADDIIRRKDRILRERLPQVNPVFVFLFNRLIEDRIEKMYRLTALSNTIRPPTQQLREKFGYAIESPVSGLKKLRQDLQQEESKEVLPLKELHRPKRFNQYMDKNPIPPDHKLQIKSKQQSRQIVENLPLQLQELIRDDYGITLEEGIETPITKIPVTDRVRTQDPNVEDRIFNQKYNSKPIQDLLTSDREKGLIAAKMLPRSQRKKKYKELNMKRLDEFRKKYNFPKRMSYEELSMYYKIFNQESEEEYNY